MISTRRKLSIDKQKALLLEMVRTDFKLRYQSSILGYVWSVLKPLFLFAILYTVFSRFLKLGAGVPNYALSLLLGIILWQFFADATSGALKSIVGKGSLIRKIDIPRHLIPIASTASAFINMLLNLAVFFIFVIFSSENALGWNTIVVLPLLIVQLIMFTMGVGFFLAAVYVKLRDINYVWEVVRQALFYTIPIIYPLSRIPSESFRKLLTLNPISDVIQTARTVVTYDGTINAANAFNNQYMFVVPLTITVAVLVLGAAYFRRHSSSFAENI